MYIGNFLSVISEISRSQAELVFPAVTSYHTQGNLTEHMVILINVDICKIRFKGSDINVLHAGSSWGF